MSSYNVLARRSISGAQTLNTGVDISPLLIMTLSHELLTEIVLRFAAPAVSMLQHA